MLSALTPFTQIHVAISLVAILTGFVVMYGLVTAKRLENWTFIFLVFTIATSVTGFLFPITGFTPALGTGIVSMLVLIPAWLARYNFNLAGAWRWVYVVGATVGLYLNVFVLIVQSFQKIPPLNALAPTGTEPPFLIAQSAALVLFIVLGFLAVRRFHVPAPAPA